MESTVWRGTQRHILPDHPGDRYAAALSQRPSRTWTGTSSPRHWAACVAARARRHHTATAYLTFVALDSNGRPTPVPPIAPATEKDRERYRAAQERRKARLALKEALARRPIDG